MKLMNNVLKKTICFLAAAIISCSLCVSEASAEVFTASISGGKTGSVYIAGNPDLYPIEYYDAATETYMGLIPDMLEIVSEKTGIDFTYISADKENKQRNLYKNNQVELVTAIMYDDASFKDAEKITVLTAKDRGETVKYCIAFTDVLDEATEEKIEKALAEISDSQKASFIIEHAQTDVAASRRQRTIITTAVMAVLAAAAAIAAYIIMRKKKEAARLECMIDRNTGIGNADYYLYAFEHLISEQSKNLYNLAYIAFDTDAFGERKCGMTIGSIEKYAASKLNQYAAAMEYVSYADEGVFLFLFQAESAEAAEQRVSEILMGINIYISELANGCDDLFKAGYCRFFEHVGVNAETAVYNAKQGYTYAEKHNIFIISARKCSPNGARNQKPWQCSLTMH